MVRTIRSVQFMRCQRRGKMEVNGVGKFNSHVNGDKKAETSDDLRKTMTKFWQVYDPTVQSMMLSHDAELIAELEQNEVLSYFPEIEGKNVLELGAGIGRYSAKVAEVAGHLTAVDFMESYIAQNRKTNAHFNNITYKCADVTKLEFAPGSFDFIFTNWLLMYLDEIEIEALFSRILKWLKPAGNFFIRESCYYPSGNFNRPKDPTKYRMPMDYINLLSTASTEDNSFSILFSKNLLTFVIYKGNPNQVCILSQKQESVPLQKDHSLPPRDVMSLCPMSELSSGKELIIESFSKLKLSAGQKVIHLHSGSGEESFLLADKFMVFVHAIEESQYFMQCSLIKQDEQNINIKNKVQFEARQITGNIFSPDNYDAAVCFKSFIRDSREIFLCCKDSIKQGGKFLLSSFFPVNTQKNGNNNCVTADDLKTLIESHGFRVELERKDEIAMLMMKELRNKIQKEKNCYDDSNELKKIQENEGAISKGILHWVNISAVKL